jgi:hypothetical protein
MTRTGTQSFRTAFDDRNVTDEEQVKSLIKFSYECKEVLEGGVVQGTRISDNTYRKKPFCICSSL